MHAWFLYCSQETILDKLGNRSRGGEGVGRGWRLVKGGFVVAALDKQTETNKKRRQGGTRIAASLVIFACDLSSKVS